MAKELKNIIEEYEKLRSSFSAVSKIGNYNKDTLIDFERSFVELKADLRPHIVHVTGQWQRRDDKSATAIKGRIMIAIADHDFKNEEGQIMYPDCSSINQAEKYASGTKEYRKFINERSFWKESLVNVTHLRGDIESYINLIKDLLKREN